MEKIHCDKQLKADNIGNPEGIIEAMRAQIRRDIQDSNRILPATGDDWEGLPKAAFFGKARVSEKEIVQPYAVVIQGTEGRYMEADTEEVAIGKSMALGQPETISGSRTEHLPTYIIDTDEEGYTRVEEIPPERVQDRIASSLIDPKITVTETIDDVRRMNHCLFIRGEILRPKLRVEL